MVARTCDRCSEPATRTCISDFAYLCEEHRGSDPHACTWCLAQLTQCGCERGCDRCGLSGGPRPQGEAETEGRAA